MQKDRLEVLKERRLYLLALLTQLTEDAASIKDQLLRAAHRRRTTGESVSADWFFRASLARRLKLHQMRQIQTDLAKINYDIKWLNVKTQQDPNFVPSDDQGYYSVSAPKPEYQMGRASDREGQEGGAYQSNQAPDRSGQTPDQRPSPPEHATPTHERFRSPAVVTAAMDIHATADALYDSVAELLDTGEVKGQVYQILSDRMDKLDTALDRLESMLGWKPSDHGRQAA